MKKLIIPFYILLIISCAGSPVGKLEDMVPCDTSDLSEFHKNIRYYIVEQDIETVWKAYTEVSLDKFWHGPIAKFDTMYNPLVKSKYAAGDSEIPEVSEEQIIHLNLLVDDYIHIPVSFQIKTLDPEDKLIEFVYMEQNTSHGKQEIRFYASNTGGHACTLIYHKSWFHSDSSIRDTLFYGHYHTQIIDEFHLSASESTNYSVRPVTERYLKRKGLSDQA